MTLSLLSASTQVTALWVSCITVSNAYRFPGNGKTIHVNRLLLKSPSFMDRVEVMHSFLVVPVLSSTPVVVLMLNVCELFKVYVLIEHNFQRYFEYVFY